MGPIRWVGIPPKSQTFTELSDENFHSPNDSNKSPPLKLSLQILSPHCFTKQHQHHQHYQIIFDKKNISFLFRYFIFWNSSFNDLMQSTKLQNYEITNNTEILNFKYTKIPRICCFKNKSFNFPRKRSDPGKHSMSSEATLKTTDSSTNFQHNDDD